MKKVFFATLGLSILTGCSAIPLNPGAEKVQVAFRPPAKECEFLGYIQGAQGGFFSGGWTSNSNLQQGAANDVRNKAFAMGGNYVELIGDKSQQTSSYSASGSPYGFGASGGTQQTGVIMNGNAFKCPKKK